MTRDHLYCHVLEMINRTVKRYPILIQNIFLDVEVLSVHFFLIIKFSFSFGATRDFGKTL